MMMMNGDDANIDQLADDNNKSQNKSRDINNI